MLTSTNNAILLPSKPLPSASLPSFDTLFDSIDRYARSFKEQAPDPSKDTALLDNEFSGGNYSYQSSHSTTLDLYITTSNKQDFSDDYGEEIEINSFLDHFFSTDSHMIGCLQQLQSNFQGHPVPYSLPQPHSSRSRSRPISSRSFQRFVTSIPYGVIEELSSSMMYFAEVLQSIKHLKRNYIHQNKLSELRYRSRSDPSTTFSPVLYPKQNVNELSTINSSSIGSIPKYNPIELSEPNCSKLPHESTCSSKFPQSNCSSKLSPLQSIESTKELSTWPTSITAQLVTNTHRRSLTFESRFPNGAISSNTKRIKKKTNGKKSRHFSSCTNCKTRETPEWRRGPNGQRSLCNACGLFFSKLTRRYGSTHATKIFYHRNYSGSVENRTVPSVEEYDSILSLAKELKDFQEFLNNCG